MNAPPLGWLTWLAMLLVLGAAAVLSFAALRDLAELCGVDPPLAPLLPVAIDAGAAASTKVWLDGRAVVAERFARTMTFALLATTVAGNALHSGLVAAGLTPTWWTAVVVGAVPPAVVGATVHLAVLVGRPAESGRPERAEEATGQILVGHLNRAESGSGQHDLGTAEVDPSPQRSSRIPEDQAAALIASGAGRRRLSRELGITEHAARELLDGRRNGVTR